MPKSIGIDLRTHMITTILLKVDKLSRKNEEKHRKCRDYLVIIATETHDSILEQMNLI